MENNPYSAPNADIAASPSYTGGPLKLATPWIRLGAAIIDGLIALAVILPIAFIFGWFTPAAADLETAVVGGFIDGIIHGLIGIVVVIAINWIPLAQGQTWGKRVLNLRIVRTSGSAADRNHIILKRYLPIQIASLLPIIGGIIVIVDSLCIFRRERNTIHDDIADTRVITLK